MNAVDPARKLPRLGPESRVLRRGVSGDKVDGRSREGLLLLQCEGELTAQIGGAPAPIAGWREMVACCYHLTAPLAERTLRMASGAVMKRLLFEVRALALIILIGDAAVTWLDTGCAPGNR